MTELPRASSRHHGPLLTLLAVSAILVAASSATAVDIDWVTVHGNGVANLADPQSQGDFGVVTETFEIGKFEVTNAQYAEFLNATAQTDPNSLYAAAMATDIVRTGSSGSFAYAPVSAREDHPAANVSFYNALRFANWLENGQPTGPQGPTTTEDGSYLIDATGIANNTIVRKAGATVFLPSENEWYKAAYYEPNSAVYFAYPTGNTQTVCSNFLAGNAANCNNVVGDTTVVGFYGQSASPNWTFDQGGNLWEWNETIIGAKRGRRGAARASAATSLAAATRDSVDPTVVNSSTGFRVARWTPLQGGVFDVSPLVLEGDPAPSGLGVFTAFGENSPNSGGDVAFPAETSSGAEGLFLSSGGTITPVALIGEVTPSGGTFDSIGPAILSDSGSIAYAALANTVHLLFLDTPGQIFPAGLHPLHPYSPNSINASDTLLFAQDLGGGVDFRLRSYSAGIEATLVQMGDPAPDGGDFFFFADGFSLNDAGDFAFVALTDLTGLGVYRSVGGVLSAAALPGASASGTGDPLLPDAAFPTGINGAGDILFSASVGSDQGAFRFRAADGMLEVVAVPGDSLTDVGGAVLLGFESPTFTDDDEVFFQAKTGGGDAILVDESGLLSTVVAEGEAVPGLAGAVFSEFFYPSAGDSGTVTFSASIRGGSNPPVSGIFVATRQTTACSDLIDNDLDGQIDTADPGCADGGDDSERDASLPCDDGEDNDSDGRGDFDPVTKASPGDSNTPPAGFGDPGCGSPTWTTESPQCQNGVDDADPDTLVDYDGGFSITGTPGQLHDPTCAGRPWFKSEADGTGGGGGCSAGLVGLLCLPLWLRRRRG